MFEEFPKDIAQRNGLREVNVYLKIIAGLGAIVLCPISGRFIPPLFIAALLSMAVPVNKGVSDNRPEPS